MARGGPLVRMEGISKAFPGVLANDRISFEVADGEIHALVGENGAGKTTLMRILYGLERPDEGQIVWLGRPVAHTSPLHAIRLGIGMVHQHFQLIPSMTAAENIALGQEPRRGIIFDRARAREAVRDLVARFGLQIDPDAPIADLSVGQQQRVEILKLLYRNARLLILDEPTAVLTPQEARDLFAVLRNLAAEGKTIIFISHKLSEVLAVSTRITVLRRGRVVGTVATAAAAPGDLARMIVGDTLPEAVSRTSVARGEPVLALADLTVLDDRGLTAVDRVSVAVHRGEILAVAGVDGNGQKELAEAITGIRLPAAGRILLAGQEITALPVAVRRAGGLAVVPADRNIEGLSLAMTIEENLLSTRYRHFSRGGLLRRRAIRMWADDLIRRFDVRAAHARVLAGVLSGGNLQRLVVARELATPPVVLLASHPTRGLDIAATHFVQRQISKIRERGGGVILISADLDEILTLADRIAVLFNGRIIGELAAAAATPERLGLLMAGRETVA